MKDVLNDIERWRAAGKRVAVARVVGLDGSGPRDPGAAMAVNEDSEVAGSVSGGSTGASACRARSPACTAAARVARTIVSASSAGRYRLYAWSAITRPVGPMRREFGS